MSQVVKKKPAAREIVREGAAEVGEKLKADISRWTRVRRVVSLKPMIGCFECDAAGKLVCESCGGTGKTKIQLQEDTPLSCPTCDGTGHTTCVACAGQGVVPNVHRKKFLWMLVIGGIAWVLVFLQLWGRDLFPAQMAKVTQRGEHGQSAIPGGLGGMAPRGGLSVSSPGTTPAPGSMPAAPTGAAGGPIGRGMTAPGGGAVSVPTPTGR